MKTQLVSAIHLQEVELQEKPADNMQGRNNSKNGETGTSYSNNTKQLVEVCAVPPAATRGQQHITLKH